MVSMLRLEDSVLIKEFGLGYGGRPMCFSFFFLMVFALFLRFRWFIHDHHFAVKA